eukprot:gb/GFBE01080085.1/.p1 GENE.gb/GFBE01080085.1/~~gb/GFBE01080085.1/.p1  ORF type:complete len:170 (+),score=26.71 gb/GFBE01080085.1/:1-510(+)
MMLCCKTQHFAASLLGLRRLPSLAQPGVFVRGRRLISGAARPDSQASEGSAAARASPDEDPEKCPVFGAPGTGLATQPPTPILRVFRAVPPGVVQAVHTWYWLLVGGPVPRHLQHLGVGAFLSMEVIAIRLAARFVGLVLGLWALAAATCRLWRLTGRQDAACPETSAE